MNHNTCSSIINLKRNIIFIMLLYEDNNNWFYGVVVSTLDFESSDLGSTPGRTSFVLFCFVLFYFILFSDKLNQTCDVQSSNVSSFDKK